MTEYKIDFKKREFNPHTIVRACFFFYHQLDNHLKNVHHLSKETLKYYVDRLLEATLLLEDYSNQLYESLDSEEKDSLESLEEIRNSTLYKDKVGNDLSKNERDTIDKFLESYRMHYERLREESKARFNHPLSHEI